MKSFLLHMLSPMNLGAIVVADSEQKAMELLSERFDLVGKKCKFQSKEIKWVKIEMFSKPEVVFVK